MRTRKWPESFFIFVYRGRIPSGSKAELARILLDFPSRFFLSPSFRVSVSLSIPVIYFRRPSPSGKPFSHPRYPDPHNHWRLIRSGGQAVACREWKRGLKPGLSAIVFFVNIQPLPETYHPATTDFPISQMSQKQDHLKKKKEMSHMYENPTTVPLSPSLSFSFSPLSLFFCLAFSFSRAIWPKYISNRLPPEKCINFSSVSRKRSGKAKGLLGLFFHESYKRLDNDCDIRVGSYVLC